MTNAKKKKFLTPKNIITTLTALLVIYVVYKNWPDIQSTISHLGETNLLVLLLLIPEQLLMYYSCGQIFFSYIEAKRKKKIAENPDRASKLKKIPQSVLTKISIELNFVNHAIPAGGLGGLGYITWRLLPYGSSAGDTSFTYILRYAITVIGNQLQTFIAIAVLAIFGAIPASATWILWATAGLSLAIILGIALIVVIASAPKRIHWFAKISSGFVKFVTKPFTKKTLLKYETVDEYLMDIHKNILIAKKDLRILRGSVLWGFLYSFLEIATYEFIAIALGHGDLFPQIMIGEAIGSVFGAIIPYGLYELGMAGVMTMLGVDTGLALVIVTMTRILVLGTTILTGYGFYQAAINQMDKKDAKKINEINEEN